MSLDQEGEGAAARAGCAPNDKGAARGGENKGVCWKSGAGRAGPEEGEGIRKRHTGGAAREPRARGLQ